VAPRFGTCRHPPCASFAMVLSSDCVARRNVRPRDAAASDCPTAHSDPCSAVGANGFIQVEAAVVDRMRAMRRPGESYSEVIFRLVELKMSDLK
jgi:hypothetical protein